jgi:hypothetical protein
MVARLQFETPERIAQRFWKRVNKEGPVHPILGTRCWLWTGAKATQCRGQAGRYGTLKVLGISTRAHRYAWTLFFGEIPEGKCILQVCKVNECVNPAHLFIGTRTPNG